MLKVNNKDKSQLSFKMKSSIEREILFSWGSVKELILNDFAEKTVIVFIDSKVYEGSEDWQNIEAKHNSLKLFPTNLIESSKNLDSLVVCLEILENEGFSRRHAILMALGGGVLMDLVSLAASLYRRGVSVLKVPSTLVGFVDASVGIKTGINFLGQRNRLGSYYLNYDVFYDVGLLETLSEDLIKEGLGEIFKIAIIKSKELFEILEENVHKITDPSFYQSKSGKRIISISVELMLEELHENPTEENLKRCVDFGHSFSPLMEMKSIEIDEVSTIPHGIAVAIDCIITSIISNRRGLLDANSLERILSLAQGIGFNFEHPLYKRKDILWSSMMDMTKHRGGNQNLPSPTSIGSYSFIQDLTFNELSKALEVFGSFPTK